MKKGLALVGVIALIACLTPLIWAEMWHQSIIWNYQVDFEEYAEEFNLVKDYMLQQYPDGGDKGLSVSVSNQEEVKLYDYELEQYVECPKEVAAAIVRLNREAFSYKSCGLDYITLSGKQVFFEIELNPYAVVYSPEEKPKRESAQADKRCLVKSIGDGWYHMTVD